MIRKQCRDVDFGSFECAVSIQKPFGRRNTIFIDKCLLNEVQHLWSLEIETACNCCGHKRSEPSICVHDESVERMIELGYKNTNEYPDRPDIFLAKSELSEETDIYPNVIPSGEDK